MLFLLMNKGCASPATELLEFFEEMEQDFLKKLEKKAKKSSDKRSLMFWGAVEIDADVVRDLFENYTNPLLAIKKANGVRRRY